MKKEKEEISVVWFKRDLRLEDNEAISNALAGNKRVLLLYAFENLLLQDEHYDQRHWNFIKQSLVDINKRLAQFNTKVLTVQSDIINFFNQIQNTYKISGVYSHQETGLLATYNRDKDFTRYCRNNSIPWTENINNGVLRGLLNREDWFEKWEDYMNQPLIASSFHKDQFLSIEEIESIEKYFQKVNLSTPISKQFQHGGTETAWKYANTFFENRHKNYMYHISKPAESRESCSRLSPYIAWGNVSIRQVYQKAKSYKNETNKST